ncbi:MAG: NAD(+) diphosphatase [Treponema sp.]|jgi:NAD+ diphosphatase|nr:NAD(+) diphosphatase [Treponema sp.]
MAGSRVYLFLEDSLAVPPSIKDHEAPGGVDGALVRETALGRLRLYLIPGLLHPGGISGETAAKNPAPAVYGAFLDPHSSLPGGWRTIPVRRALACSAAAAGLPGTDRTAEQLLRTYHVLQWLKDSLYCGSCGAANGDSSSELARLCPRCGRIEYPRISPAVIVMVLREDGRALLAHNDKFKAGLYSLIAGFAEAGESLEAAAVREIREEVNIGVEELRYVVSQSWPFPNSLMAGFTARYAEGEVKCDGREILDARWFSPESVRGGTPEIPSPGSVARFIIERWLEGTL